MQDKIKKLYEKGDFQKVIKECDKILENDEGDIFSLYYKSDSLLELGKYEDAIKIFNKLIIIHPSNKAIFYNKGQCYMEMGIFEEAIKSYKKSHKIDPYDLDTLNNIGISYLHSGKYKEALKWYKKGYKLNSEDVYILNNIAMAYSYLGEYKKALKYFNMAIQIAPDDHDIKNKIEKTLNIIKNFKENQLKIKLDIKGNEYTESELENIWCLIENNNYIVNNIPIFKNNLSLGDKIIITKRGNDIYFDKIIEKSGNKTIRLYFSENCNKKNKNKILKYLEKKGYGFEVYEEFLLGINIPNNSDFQKIIDFLEENIENIFYEISDDGNI